jgi:cytochrome c biogenesis protein CcmG/thiol:disulfide interchange protein DsbE
MSSEAAPPAPAPPSPAPSGSEQGSPVAKRIGQAAALLVVAALLALLIWKVATRDSGGAAAKLAAGNGAPVAAPQFTLPRIGGIPGSPAGGPISLASLHGKVVVLNFWASWCIPCKQESPRMQEAYLRYRDQGVVVLGVDAQDFTGDARRFATKYKLTYPIVHDGSGKTLTPYGVTGFPETFFLDRTGKLVGERIEGEISVAQLDAGIKRALAT